MVILFVSFTILVFIGIGIAHQRMTNGKEKTAQQSSDRLQLPKGFFLSPSHTWLELLFSGEVKIGIDDFVQKIVGTIDLLHIAPIGTEVRKGDTIITLHSGKNVLNIPAPVSGKIVHFNQEAVHSPQVLNTDPYITGWIVVLNPSDITTDLQQCTISREATSWMHSEVTRFRDFLKLQSPHSASIGTTMLDGGLPLTGALHHCTEKSWIEFEQEFFQGQNSQDSRLDQ